MRRSFTSAVLAAVSAFLLSCTYAQAQASSPCMVGVINAVPPVVAPHGPPFSAVIKITFDQKLVDGNSVHGTIRLHIARDTSGKTMSQSPSTCYVGEDGHEHQMYYVIVYDPAAKISENWRLDGSTPGIATIFHLSPPTKPSQEELTAMSAARARQATQGNEWRTENLGTQTLQGVSADGTKRTRTIPAGEEGNALPLEIVNESWISRELGITMMSISDDPRRGRSTSEIEELNHGEPDPSIFAPPPGYIVRDQKPSEAPVATQ